MSSDPLSTDDEPVNYFIFPGISRLIQIERVLADQEAVARDIETYRARIVQHIGAAPSAKKSEKEIEAKCFACAEPIAQMARICRHCLSIQPEFIEEVIAFQLSLQPDWVEHDDA